MVEEMEKVPKIIQLGDAPFDEPAEEKTAEDIDIGIVKATDIVRDYFFRDKGPWIFLYQTDDVAKNTAENVYVVKCSFFPIQGGYEKNHYTVKVNVKSGVLISLTGFSLNIKTNVKKPLTGESPLK